MILIRIIVMQGLLYNVKISAKHVPGVLNKFADSLSRQNMKLFNKLSNGFHYKDPIKIPEMMWPMEKLWYDDDMTRKQS